MSEGIAAVLALIALAVAPAMGPEPHDGAAQRHVQIESAPSSAPEALPPEAGGEPDTAALEPPTAASPR